MTFAAERGNNVPLIHLCKTRVCDWWEKHQSELFNLTEDHNYTLSNNSVLLFNVKDRLAHRGIKTLLFDQKLGLVATKKSTYSLISEKMKNSVLGMNVQTTVERELVKSSHRHGILVPDCGFAFSLQGYSRRSTDWIFLDKIIDYRKFGDCLVAFKSKVIDGRQFECVMRSKAVRPTGCVSTGITQFHALKEMARQSRLIIMTNKKSVSDNPDLKRNLKMEGFEGLPDIISEHRVKLISHILKNEYGFEQFELDAVRFAIEMVDKRNGNI